jgi:hypothetical protein
VKPDRVQKYKASGHQKPPKQRIYGRFGDETDCMIAA